MTQFHVWCVCRGRLSGEVVDDLEDFDVSVGALADVEAPDARVEEKPMWFVEVEQVTDELERRVEQDDSTVVVVGDDDVVIGAARQVAGRVQLQTETGKFIYHVTHARTHTHTYTRLTALFRDYPGEPVPVR